MAAVKIVTDSTADIPKEWTDKLNIEVVPLKVHFGEESFEDGVTLTSDEFYSKLATADKIPTTSQPTPAQFEEIYKRLLENGDTVISIHLSAKLSGTFQAASIAKDSIEASDRLHVIDSKRASYAIGLIVVEAAELAASGADSEEILTRIETLLEDTTVFFMVDTLEYLQKNGRIGKASALMGSLLKIKPILSLTNEGEVYPFEKVRGSKKAGQRIRAEFLRRFNGKPLHVGISHAMAEDEAKAFMESMKEQFDIQQEVITSIGPVIGTHVGPGTISISAAPIKR
ncbi:DegV family protein [Alkalicoccus luteus]|uniref:DegV family protein n=1 Tax=Alkalicoccus luteus TaxID=1237094 RepID=A0A969TTX8_9BACI|nr:DegV family protein [Alkalicoccus luteus]NJP36396.1 DegV family protein [Alkalicoccus luteus]